MAKKSKKDNYGLDWRDFRYGIILGSVSIILYMLVSITDIWLPSHELDVIKTLIYLLIIFTASTVVIDFFIAKKKVI